MSTSDATYVIAQENGIVISKHLDMDTVDRIRGIMTEQKNNIISLDKSIKKKKSKNKKEIIINLNIGTEQQKIDVILSTELVKDAKRMAEIYPIYYIYENSIRVVISRVLKNKYGPKWWSSAVPKDVINEVINRKKEELKKPWHGKRGQHEIFYTDFKHLKKIIQKNWDDFEDIFQRRDLIIPVLDQLEHPRNVLAHHNCISKKDISRIKLHFSDWCDLLDSKKKLIP